MEPAPIIFGGPKNSYLVGGTASTAAHRDDAECSTGGDDSALRRARPNLADPPMSRRRTPTLRAARGLRPLVGRPGPAGRLSENSPTEGAPPRRGRTRGAAGGGRHAAQWRDGGARPGHTAPHRAGSQPPGLAGALRGADRRPAPFFPGQNERPAPRAPGAPRPRSRRPGHPAAGPGSGPRSWLAGLSPAGLLDTLRL